mmetsp:Transcript_9210/g.21102  ORF Transcript_9210/g.21102 Transcript_9210/m.21102 type:complete len:293 (-) Transcript_9210:1388-2266(-)
MTSATSESGLLSLVRVNALPRIILLSRVPAGCPRILARCPRSLYGGCQEGNRTPPSPWTCKVNFTPWSNSVCSSSSSSSNFWRNNSNYVSSNRNNRKPHSSNTSISSTSRSSTIRSSISRNSTSRSSTSRSSPNRTTSGSTSRTNNGYTTMQDLLQLLTNMNGCLRANPIISQSNLRLFPTLLARAKLDSIREGTLTRGQTILCCASQDSLLRRIWINSFAAVRSPQGFSRNSTSIERSNRTSLNPKASKRCCPRRTTTIFQITSPARTRAGVHVGREQPALTPQTGSWRVI